MSIGQSWVSQNSLTFIIPDQEPIIPLNYSFTWSYAIFRVYTLLCRTVKWVRQISCCTVMLPVFCRKCFVWGIFGIPRCNLVDVGPIVQSFVLYCVLIRRGDCFTTFLTVCECRRLDWFPKLIFLCFLSSCSEIRYIFFLNHFVKDCLWFMFTKL